MEAILKEIFDIERRHKLGVEQARKEQESLLKKAHDEARRLVEKEKHAITTRRETTLAQKRQEVAQHKEALLKQANKDVEKLQENADVTQASNTILELFEKIS